MKKKYLEELTERLLTKYESEVVKEIVDIASLCLIDYDISSKCTEIAVVETESVIMLKKFLATKMIEGKSKRTIKRYEYILTKMLNFLNVEIKDIDVYTLRGYLAYLEMNGSNDITVKGIRSILSSFFSWLHNEGFIEKNPTANLGTIKCKEVVKTPFDKVEVELLKENCTTIRDRALIEFLLSTGCRVSECVEMNINDIDLHNQECLIRCGKGNKERIVFIDDVCKLYLEKYLSTRKDDSEALFIGRGTPRLTDNGIRRICTRIGKNANVNHVHPHRFRHTLATVLIDRGMSIEEVSIILGHENINTTMGYVHKDIRKVKTSYSRHYS